ncbi:amino acid adenylation domain-containing protein [Steroidobacter sp. S1-65]|uniref:Amino acid adenylation domain-containing protein n=1 Tax=Steroidobacter gossypii TaxID=2805490 RepID=A0ABS1X009_9GAMM|nr:non-ribosomal peptide synthetase [Steroidobacter gossypii]MBM0106532.1 amino acid adenylation domain-containing protein [Steroidobacter gossypii]
MKTSEVVLEKISRLSPDQQAFVADRLAGIVPEAQPDAIPVFDRSVDAPASYAQRALWLAIQLDGPSPKYNMASSYELQGPLNVDALRQAFRDIVARHESLRTTFREQDGTVYQVVHDAETFGFDVVVEDWRSCEIVEDQVLERVRAHSQSLLDLVEGPLIRVSLLRLTDTSARLLMNMHHIIYDGCSKGLLLKELYTLYDYYRHRGIAPSRAVDGPSLPELPIQYRDFSAWQQRSVALDEQLAFWKRALQGAPELIALPSDFPRSRNHGDAGSSERLLLGKELSEKWLDVGRRLSASPFMTVLATLSILLSRYSGQSDIVIGTPVDNRTRREVQKVIGYFLNTLALRCSVDERMSFEAILRQVRKTCIEAYANQEAPWEQVVQVVNPARSVSHTPLFQVMLVFQNSSSHDFVLPELTITKTGAGTSTTKYDLYLTLVETPNGLEGWLTYNTALLRRTTIERFIGDFKALAREVSEAPDLALRRIPMMSDTQRDFLDRWNRTERAYPRSSVAELFRLRALEHPGKIAIHHAGGSLTFGTLEEQANELAAQIREHDIQPGATIAICMPRSPEMISSILAVFKCGCCYVPLDPALPASRRAFILEDARPQLMLTTSQASESLRAGPIPTVFANARSRPFRPPVTAVEVEEGSAAYILYTSGSTGVPKGVIGTHRGLLNRLQWMWDELPYGTDEVVCHKTTPSFVDSIAEVWGALLRGVPVSIFPQDEHFDLYEFVEHLAARAVTRVVLVPSLLQSILLYYPNLGEKLPSLRHVTVSGEELHGSLVELFARAAPKAELLNLYGSTEVAADVTYCRLTGNAGSSEIVPIGKPIANTRMYVLDHELRPCPIGVKGQLYAGGAGLAWGYHGKASLTAEQFIPDPFGPSGARLYRTGDHARYLDDGNIEYLGRVDQQVKVRGIRVDLREIERTLLSLPSVVQAACTSSVSEANGVAIHAYACIDEDASVSRLSLVTQLRNALPEYMVPATIDLLPMLPLLPNGKVDRKSLPAPTHGDIGAEAFFEPSTQTEIAMAQIWSSALGTPRVGRNANFFDLGGHSLAATKVVAEARKRFAVELKARDVFDLLTLERLAARVDEIQAATRLLSARDDADLETIEI